VKADPTALERQRRWYYNHRDYKLSLTRERYRGLSESGTCVRCGVMPVVDGKKQCEECLKLRRRRTKEQA
jgi:hypothetical protein